VSVRSPERRAPDGLSRRAAAALPVAAAAGAAITIAAGLLLQAGAGYPLLGHVHSGAGLGTPLPPFLINWRPDLSPWAVVSVAVLVSGVAAAPRLVRSVRSPAAFAGAAYGLALALGLALNLARIGPADWARVFVLGRHGSTEAGREYLPSLVLLRRGAHWYVSHFASLLPYLTTHVKGNPPGPLLVIRLLGLTTADSLAAACIAAGALTAPLAYALGRTLGGEERGRLAAVLTAFSPALLLFGVTSVDYVFAALATAIAWLLVARGRRALAAGCCLAAVGSFSSWLLLAIPAWAVLVVLARDGPRRAALVAVCAGAAILALTLVLALTLGYHPIAVLRALGPIYRHGIAAHRPYAFWLFGSPVAWGTMLGLPVAWLALSAVAARDPAALALAALILVSAVAGFTKAETERVWLPFVGLACVAAAAVPVRRLTPLLGALACQAVVVEVLFNTVW
jgi:hypothetical protein